MLATVREHHAHGALAHLGGKLRLLRHGSTLSNEGVGRHNQTSLRSGFGATLQAGPNQPCGVVDL
jgi:hypothetical protein